MSEPNKPKACRVLFPPDTPEAGNSADEKDIDAILKEWQDQAKEAKQKWNFDFENEVPVDGDYEWERVPQLVPKKADELRGKHKETKREL